MHIIWSYVSNVNFIASMNLYAVKCFSFIFAIPHAIEKEEMPGWLAMVESVFLVNLSRNGLRKVRSEFKVKKFQKDLKLKNTLKYVIFSSALNNKFKE